MKKMYDVPEGPPQHPFLSPVIWAGDFVFVSGNAGVFPGQLEIECVAHAPEG